uniref:Uncharacterized protein n=1 Tax=Romanomermis culicivorax TaxID=13658 RepID=A0A915IAY4_ROMCU
MIKNISSSPMTGQGMTEVRKTCAFVASELDYLLIEHHKKGVLRQAGAGAYGSWRGLGVRPAMVKDRTRLSSTMISDDSKMYNRISACLLYISPE